MVNSMPTHDEVFNALSGIIDPEIGIPITQLGMIHDINIVLNSVTIDLVLTTPFCPMAASIIEAVRSAGASCQGVRNVFVNHRTDIQWDPSWISSSST